MAEQVLAFKGTDRKSGEVIDFYTETYLNPSNRLNDGLYIKLYRGLDKEYVGKLYYSFKGTEIKEDSFNIRLTYENFISKDYSTRIKRFNDDTTFLEAVVAITEDIFDVDTGLSTKKAQLEKINELREKVKNL